MQSNQLDQDVRRWLARPVIPTTGESEHRPAASSPIEERRVDAHGHLRRHG